MKKLTSLLKIALVICPTVLLTACNKNESKFENLANGKKVSIIKDSITGVAIDSVTKEPIAFYINTESSDTIYGKTGAIVNHQLIQSEDGTFMLDESKMRVIDKPEVLKTNENIKIKVNGDKMKIKTEDKKIKIDGDSRKVKYKD